MRRRRERPRRPPARPRRRPRPAKRRESTDEIDIADFKFDPEAVTVEAGTEVTWTNGDEAPHTATADDGSFDTGTLDLDDSKPVTLDQPGTYSYYCRFHPFMKGDGRGPVEASIAT